MIEEGEVVPRATSPVVPTSPVVETPPTVETTPVVATSPVAEKTVMSFPMAIQKVIDGKKITKLEWKTNEQYGFLSRATLYLTIHRDGKDSTWMVNEGDLVGKDWIVID